MITLVYLIALVAVWVLAWGTLSVANLLGGLAVGVFVLWLSPDPNGRRARLRVHPVAMVRFAGYVLFQVVWSNVVLTRTVLSPRNRLHTGVMAVPVPDCSEGLVTLIANVMALTPGTNPVHVAQHPTVIYVHVLQMDDVEKSRNDVQRLIDLAFEAFGP